MSSLYLSYSVNFRYRFYVLFYRYYHVSLVESRNQSIQKVVKGSFTFVQFLSKNDTVENSNRMVVITSL